MHHLMQVAVDAHGGLERWNQLKTVKASLSITGVIWQLKGKPDVLKDISIEAELHKERLTTHFNGQGKRTVFEPNEIAVQTESGRIVDFRRNPRAAFRGHTQQTPWDDLHVAYFSSYALWNYLTIPFLYTYPGFVTEELAPWQENGEEWQPLRVIVPDSIASHSREQVAYFVRTAFCEGTSTPWTSWAARQASTTPLTIATSMEFSCPRNAGSMPLTATSEGFQNPCWWPSTFAISHFSVDWNAKLQCRGTRENSQAKAAGIQPASNR
jgi:hypothetical protein